ncbi:hypothetical protein ACFS07_17620 [Undibacterium arcticum]
MTAHGGGVLWQGSANALSLEKQYRVARDRRGCAGDAPLRKLAYPGGLLRLSLGGCAFRDTRPSRSAQRGEGHSWPSQRGSDGWLDGDLARGIRSHARPVDSDT